ncbi:alpha/beta fold hydrolase [Rhodococcus indonesiensis]
MKDTPPSRSGHPPLNGLTLHHEVHGEPGGAATPLLLIPGAFLGTESMSAWTGAFTATRSVTVFDQQGHGCTPDTARQISDENCADDAAALPRTSSVQHAHVS